MTTAIILGIAIVGALALGLVILALLPIQTDLSTRRAGDEGPGIGGIVTGLLSGL